MWPWRHGWQRSWLLLGLPYWGNWHLARCTVRRQLLATCNAHHRPRRHLLPLRKLYLLWLLLEGCWCVLQLPPLLLLPLLQWRRSWLGRRQQ